jgi:outer membrane protein assembly factor BamB
MSFIPHLRSLLIFSIFVGSLAADDWPEFQGPGRRNVWSEEGLPTSFQADDLKRIWTAPMAAGYGGPTVAGDSVMLMDRPDESHERVVCVDRASGEVKWTYGYPCRYQQVDYGYGPRASVTIAGDRAYSLGTMGHLHCLEVATGKVIWAHDLRKEYEVRVPVWGMTSSPLVAEGVVVVQAAAGAEGANTLAFDEKTGKERWRAFDDRAGYVSPLLIEQGGKPVVVAWSGERLAGLNPATGKSYWEIPTPPTRMPINVPAPALNLEGTRMFLSVFYDGSKMIALDPDKPAAELLWKQRGINERKTKALHCMISPPFVRGDHIYGIDSYGQMRCLDAKTGERVWEDQQAVPRGRWATVFMVPQADTDRVWAVNEAGELILARITPEGYQEISRAKVIEPTTPLRQRPSGTVLWVPPAFADGCLYLRNDRELIKVRIAKAKSK